MVSLGSVACPIDRQPPAATSLAHYVVIRADLPLGLKVANTVHAAGLSASWRDGPLPTDTIAVALAARDESHLHELSVKLAERNILHHPVRESDGPYAGQWMAIGLEPTADRDAVRKVVSHLPLVR